MPDQPSAVSSISFPLNSSDCGGWVPMRSTYSPWFRVIRLAIASRALSWSAATLDSSQVCERKLEYRCVLEMKGQFVAHHDVFLSLQHVPARVYLLNRRSIFLRWMVWLYLSLYWRLGFWRERSLRSLFRCFAGPNLIHFVLEILECGSHCICSEESVLDSTRLIYEDVESSQMNWQCWRR